jgi:hypothetical protein
MLYGSPKPGKKLLPPKMSTLRKAAIRGPSSALAKKLNRPFCRNNVI